jgi:uncharacterized protein (DUF952 family)
MILHILNRLDWDNAVRRGRYAPESLRLEGFIHCSTPAQVIDTANRFYRGQKDLIVLCIDETRVTAELRYEAPVTPDNLTPNCFPSAKANQKAGGEWRHKKAGELFPHLHGELNLDAVVRIVELVCEEDGSFRALERMTR